MVNKEDASGELPWGLDLPALRGFWIFRGLWRYTIASGRDGLYIAAWSGKGGRWRLSWDALDQVKWKPVKGCEIDGFPMEEISAPKQQPAAKP